MPSESIHEKLQRVRRPHVHIKYEVETEGAAEVHELPFVVGVMGDFSGDGIEEMGDLRDRKFKDINRDNFDSMMKSMKPSLNFSVDNELSGNPEEQLSVNLKFEKMEDFSPAGVARQVPELAALLKKRDEIIEFKNELERNGKLEKDVDKFLKGVAENSPKPE
jgi:type VI secretion system protein ImpB